MAFKRSSVRSRPAPQSSVMEILKITFNIITSIFFILFLQFSTLLHAQYFIGNYSKVFQDSTRSNRNVPTEIYYPSISEGNNTQVAFGQFPIIIFGHGFLMSYGDYQSLWEELVPKGYIILFPRTEEGLINDHQEFGWDLQFLVTEMQEEGADNYSPVFNAVANNTALMGHSMGGGAAFLAADSLTHNQNAQLKTIIGLAPAESSSNGVSSISSALNVSTPALILSGSQDGVTPPEGHHLPMFNNLSSGYKTFISILGGAHCYFGEPNFFCDFGEATASSGISISREDQQNITFDFVNLWLDYTLKESCEQYNAFQDSVLNSNRIAYDQIHQENPTSTIIETNGVLSSSVIGSGYQWYMDNSPIEGANDVTFTPNESGYYFVEVFFVNGCPTTSESYTFEFLTTSKSKLIPDQFFLHQNYPNPFNPMTSISYDLEQDVFVNLSIFDMNGKIIKCLVNEFQNTGNYSLNWDGVNFAGKVVSAGIYLYVLQVGGSKKTKKMSFIK